MREHIHGLHFFDTVAVFAKHAEVACERFHVARDIDNPFRRKGHDAFEKRQIAAGARRVHKYNVDLLVRLGGLHHKLARVGAVKLYVAGVVELRVLLCIAHGVGVELHADHALGVPGGAKADGADPAICVEHRFAACQRGKVDRFAVKHFGLDRIDLIKRARRNPEPAAAKYVFDIALAEQYKFLFAEHQARFGAVDTLDHRGDFGMQPQQLI